MRIAYLDCFSGISGDMLLGALVDAGLGLETLRARLADLPLAGYRIEAAREVRRGVAGARVRVELEAGTSQPERGLADLLALLAAGRLSPTVRDRAARVFRRLAEAEARVHGVPVEAVHFHEVGAVDSVVDVVGALVGLEELGIERLYCSSLPTGGGFVRSRHGELPVPAPAALRLLEEARAPLRPLPVEGELVTPTGAAMIAELASFEQPPMRLERTGYGFGTRDLPWPNALRIWIGSALEPVLGTDEVVLLETNLDDASPEVLGYTLERLFAAGALDVWLTPVQMKKNRPGVVLAALAPPARASELAGLILAETPTLGIRVQRMGRLVAPRSEASVQTPYGPVRVKIKHLDDRRVVAPEYEECARIAREHGLPLMAVYQAALRAADELTDQETNDGSGPPSGA